MAFILANNKIYEETNFDDEAELEGAIILNKTYVFGSNIVYLDYKIKTGKKDSRNTGVPDGFLIDFTNPKNPKLFFVEHELESHDLYEHIGPQIMRFYASFETAKRELQIKLNGIMKDDPQLKNEIEQKRKNTPFENIDALFNYLIYDKNIGIVLVIDEQTEDLNALLKRLRDVPEVIVLKKYQFQNEIIYQYTPFREGITQEVKEIEKRPDLADIDTIVCPAREEGFKHAFLNNDAWWAIRISPSFIPQLKYIAMYETKPVSAIRWVAKIKQNGIQPYKNTGKYIVYVEKKLKIGPIELGSSKKGIAPQAPRYTNFGKLKNAKKVIELW